MSRLNEINLQNSHLPEEQSYSQKPSFNINSISLPNISIYDKTGKLCVKQAESIS